MYRLCLLVALLLPLAAAEQGHRFDGDESLCAEDTIVSNCDTADGSLTNPFIITDFRPTEVVESCPDADPFTGEQLAFLAFCGLTKSVEVRALHVVSDVPAAGLVWIGGGNLHLADPVIDITGTAFAMKGDTTNQLIIQNGSMNVELDVGYTRSAFVAQDISLHLEGLQLHAANAVSGFQFSNSIAGSAHLLNVRGSIAQGGNVLSAHEGWNITIEGAELLLDAVEYPALQTTFNSAAIYSSGTDLTIRNSTLTSNTYGIRVHTGGNLLAQGNTLDVPDGVALQIGSTSLSSVFGICGMTASHNDIFGSVENGLTGCEAPLQQNYWGTDGADSWSHSGLVNTSTQLTASQATAPWLLVHERTPGFATQRGPQLQGTTTHAATIQMFAESWQDVGSSDGVWSVTLPTLDEGATQTLLRACANICGPATTVEVLTLPQAAPPLAIVHSQDTLDASNSYSAAGLDIVAYHFVGPSEILGDDAIVPATAGNWTIRVQDELGQWSTPVHVTIHELSSPIENQESPAPFAPILFLWLARRLR